MQDWFYLRLIIIISSLVVLLSPSLSARQKASLSIESWRSDDINIWEKIILPKFHQRYADKHIKVQFKPTEAMSYNQNLSFRFKNGTAGDLIVCRPFDQSLNLYQQKYLLPLNELKGIENFSTRNKSAWSTDSGDVDKTNLA